MKGGVTVKGMAIGLTVGFVLGMAMSASAVGGWYSTDTLLTHTPEFQDGYVAGVSDALEAIVDARPTYQYLGKQMDCLNAPSKTQRLGDFRDWAMGRMQVSTNKASQAASVVIGDACEP